MNQQLTDYQNERIELHNEIYRLRQVLMDIAKETTIQPGTFDDVMNGTGHRIPTPSAEYAKMTLMTTTVLV